MVTFGGLEYCKTGMIVRVKFEVVSIFGSEKESVTDVEAGV
jgi:hypothetical protein